MKLIVGLGNPGVRYTRTRHNAGRSLIEYLAKIYKLSLAKNKSLEVSWASLNWEGEEVALAYPDSFMNVSGKPVGSLVRHFEVNPRKDLLVVVDDAALPFGELRLRSKGSDGGHHGLESVAEKLGTTAYARLRIGIGTPLKDHPANAVSLEAYVLSLFTRPESEALPQLFERGRNACRLWVQGPIEAAMNIINSSPA